MAKRVLFIASNYGLWAEELEAPWNALKGAGFENVLATYKGVTPLPIQVSMDPAFIDPLQKYPVNPQPVVDRVNALLDSGEWDAPVKISAARMSDYDALVMVGGPGAALDITGNPFVHRLILDAFRSRKTIGAICYAVAALAFTRDPQEGDQSIVRGKRVTAHPAAWDFDFDMGYPLVRTTSTNKGTDIITPGFLFPLQHMMEDAVGDPKLVLSDPSTNREKPLVAFDAPFVTGLSVESAIAFGKGLVSVLQKAA
jgi:putative intracellular protease/amidase